MLDTKRAYGKTDGVQYYHVIQSFKPSEVSPVLALEIAKEFAQEHLPCYEAVIAIHVDQQHIHAHTIFNSVNADTGAKYHSTPQTYYGHFFAGLIFGTSAVTTYLTTVRKKFKATPHNLVKTNGISR